MKRKSHLLLVFILCGALATSIFANASHIDIAAASVHKSKTKSSNVDITIQNLNNDDNLRIVHVGKNKIVIQEQPKTKVVRSNKSTHAVHNNNKKMLSDYTKKVLSCHKKKMTLHHTKVAVHHYHRRHIRHYHRHHSIAATKIQSQGNWYLGGQFGFATLDRKPQEQKLGSNGIEHYSPAEVGSSLMFGVDTGYYFSHLAFWPHALSVGIHYNYSDGVNVKGIVAPYSIPSYNYNYKIRTQSLLVVSQFDLIQWDNFAPFAELGLGVSRNESYAYQESALANNDPRKSLAFASHSTTNFSYLVGLGLRYYAGQHWIISIQDSYQDFGKTDLGQSPVASHLTKGPQADIRQNQATLGLTYQF
jgi:opacity protein-like surface antigen